MGRAGSVRRRVGLLALLLATLALAACSETNRYKVLTFFFTGVPPPGEATGAAQANGTALQVASAKVQEARAKSLKTLEQRRRRALVPRLFMHGPFASGNCSLCHATATSQVFRDGQAVAAEATGTSGGSFGARLAFPLEELCLGCHTEKGQAYAAAHGLWAHGPVANGLCTECHNPHAAPRHYMLKQETNLALCTNCHVPADLKRNPVHDVDPIPECTTCHNPHLGRTAFLLNWDYTER